MHMYSTVWHPSVPFSHYSLFLCGPLHSSMKSSHYAVGIHKSVPTGLVPEKEAWSGFRGQPAPTRNKRHKCTQKGKVRGGKMYKITGNKLLLLNKGRDIITELCWTWTVCMRVQSALDVQSVLTIFRVYN